MTQVAASRTHNRLVLHSGGEGMREERGRSSRVELLGCLVASSGP